MKIAIIGAGIGGLSVGIGLKKQGHQVTVYEKVKEILPVGAALSLWSNGIKCLNYLGLTEQVKRLGGQMDGMAYMDGKTGETMTQFSLLPLYDEVGQRPYPVSRAELQNMLMDEFGREDIKLGTTCTGLETIENNGQKGMRVFFADSDSTAKLNSIDADLVIGADGTHSKCREYVLGKKIDRRYAGYVNFNGLVTMDDAIAPLNEWTTYVGDGQRASVMPIADNRFYFFLDVPLPKGLENDRTQYRALLKEYFSGWCEPVQLLIDSIEVERTNRVEIHDIDPFNTWIKDRCVLLGDSAHSTTPDIGQGGCQALEDAVYFTRSLLINTNSLEDALVRYQNVRSKRANELVLRARKRCDVVHMHDKAVTENWYNELRNETGERIIQGIKGNILGNPLD